MSQVGDVRVWTIMPRQAFSQSIQMIASMQQIISYQANPSLEQICATWKNATKAYETLKQGDRAVRVSVSRHAGNPEVYIRTSCLN